MVIIMGKKVEVLAPAGNYEAFIAACQNGANAIYMGLDKFNARAMAKNFTNEEYIECIRYAHLRGIKVYLTLNTLMYDDEISKALELVLMLYGEGLDAVILQDIGLAMLIKDMLPDLNLHASTQMSVYNLKQVKFLEKLGFSRVVLARELSISEIEYICKNSNIEIEVFVHGALCVSVSGQCLLSSSIGNRSANRGKCAQPCRMKYTLLDKSGKEIVKDTYIMSKKDIFGIEKLDKLIGSGITSLKIEGRNKTPEYVAGVVSKYRKYVDTYFEDIDSCKDFDVSLEDEKELLQLFNRNGKSTGYLDGVRYKDSITLLSPKNTGFLLGKVINQKGNYIKLKLEEDIDLHDGFEIYSENEMVYSSIVTCIKDENYKIKNEKSCLGEYIWIGDVNKKIKFGATVYKTSSDKLNKKYRKTYENNVQSVKRKIDVKLEISSGKNICFEVCKNDTINETVKRKMDYIPEIAVKKELCKDQIFENFKKTKDIPFDLNLIDLKLDSNLFVPVSKLNDIRKEILDCACEEILKVDKLRKEKIKSINVSNIMDEYVIKNKQNTKEGNSDVNMLSFDYSKTDVVNSLQVYDFDPRANYLDIYQKKFNKKLSRLYVSIDNYYTFGKIIKEKYIKNVDVFLNIPNVVGKKMDDFITENLEKFLKDGIKGFLLGSYAYIEAINLLKKKYDFEVIGDYSLNISNIYSALFVKKNGFDFLSPSFDISISDIEEMSKYIQIEVVNNYTCVMTSRYCILGSFVANRSQGEVCTKPCILNNFELKDSYGYSYNIVCDSNDCIMRIIKRTRNINVDDYDINIEGIRETIIK